MKFPEFELFLRPDSASFIEGEQQLIRKGKDALPNLEAFFSGEARNEFDVPYRRLGKAMQCALETVCRLGPNAKPLEPYIRAELELGDRTAAMALGSLGSLSEESIIVLAACLGEERPDLSAESAAALIRCEQSNHPIVTATRAKSDRVEATFSRMKAYVERERKT